MNIKKNVIPNYQSAVRRVLSESKKLNYSPLRNLIEARKYNDSYLIMEGDYGGQIYLVVPVKIVKCSEIKLKELLKEIDEICWDDKDGTGIYFERMKVDSIVSGGMGGGVALEKLWLHENIEKLRKKIENILAG